MKKISFYFFISIIFFALFFFFYFSYSWVNPTQPPPLGGGVLQTDSSGLKVVTSTYFISGNVGIGTINPQQRFQVNNAPTSSFVITSAGKVGIGTTNPLQLIHLSRDSESPIILYQVATGTSQGSSGSIGPNNGGNFSNRGSYGPSWFSPTNAQTSNDQYASVTGGGTSLYLVAKTFNFNVPSDAVITGVKVEIEKSMYVEMIGGGAVYDYDVRLVVNDIIVGNNKARSGEAWPTSDTYFTYGGPNDTWGVSLTPSNVNNANFGVALSVSLDSYEYLVTANVDHIRMTVYYTVSGGGGSSSLISWATGVDKDSGTFKISNSTGFGTNDYFAITPAGNIGIKTASPITTFQVVGTSTLRTILPEADNLYNLGASNLRWARLYVVTTSVGDLVFANQFRFIESTSTSGEELLILKNQRGENILTIDEKGNLTLLGKIIAFFDEILTWFKDKILEVKELIANKIFVKEIVIDYAEIKKAKIDELNSKVFCLERDDGLKTCLTQEELEKIKEYILNSQ